MYLSHTRAPGYHGILEWLGEKLQPAVSKAGDPLRRELEVGGEELKHQLQTGGEELEARMKMGETEVVQKASDAVVLAGAAVLGIYLYMRK